MFELPGKLDLLFQRPGPEDGSFKKTTLPHQKAKVDLRSRTRRNSHDDLTPTGRHGLEIPFEIGCPHQVEDDIDAIATAGFLDLVRPIVPGEDPDIEPEGQCPFDLLPGSGGPDGSGPGGMGQLHGCGPDTASDGMNQDRLPLREVHLPEHGVESRHENLRDGPCILERDTRWNLHGCPLMHSDVLGVPASTKDPQNPVPWRPQRHPITHRFDDACILEARNVLGRPGRSWIPAHALDKVGPIQARSSNPDKNLTRPRLRPFHVSNLHGLRRTKFGDRHRLHGSCHGLLFGIPDAYARFQGYCPPNHGIHAVLFQLISVAGAVLVLSAYVAINRRWLKPRHRLYNLLNLVGAALLLWVALADRRLGFVILEAAWALIAIPPLFKPVEERTGPNEPGIMS